MSRLEKKLDSMISSLERREEDWKEEKQMWKQERQQWTEEKKALEERISKLEWETEKAEREKRRPNIVIKGANTEGENLEKKVEEYIEQKIKVKVKIEKAKEISVNAGQNVRKLVVVRLPSKEMKEERHGWNRTSANVESELSKSYEWKCMAATREHKKGRARGGVILGISKKLESRNHEVWSDNIVMQEIKHGNQKWMIIGVHSQNVAETMEIIKEKVKTKESGCVLIQGDWNARTGREGGWINKSDSESDSDDKDVRLRKSKDEKINEEGRRLIKEITEEGWCIVNGKKEEEGEFTYVGSRGELVIDYAKGCQEALDQIKEIKIGQRTESDHMPLEVYLEKKVEVGIVEKEERTKARRDWTQKLIDQFEKRCKDWERKGKEVEERWSELKEQIESAVPKV
ncbi:golgin subfamily A member 6-like protein 22 [Copidosoma floridanum]|uniref:golgin subfamily A member 6-like protein 22 n=1 Tax=Copidosoma floridanum TaxID=29053 RepID=UPI0006C977C3|nr:golgin subfamily A member 6-like protein 22 [Copidosoma floridanum]